MSRPPPVPPRGFPVGLTVAAALGFALLAGLGAWQVHRLQWKEAMIARIAALSHAAARPLAEVLAAGGDTDFVRVEADCAATPAMARTLFRYGVQDGQVGWRLLGACRTPAGPYDGIVVDRGYVARLAGLTSPTPAPSPGPAHVTGVLRAAGARPLLGPALMESAAGFAAWRVMDRASLQAIAAEQGLKRPAPMLLAAETETPAPAGVVPAALPQDVPNNHLAYALTWFALAGVLAWFYGAMLIQRVRR